MCFMIPPGSNPSPSRLSRARLHAATALLLLLTPACQPPAAELTPVPLQDLIPTDEMHVFHRQPGDRLQTVSVQYQDGAWELSLQDQDQFLLPGVPVSPYPFRWGMAFSEGDLNGDGRRELLLRFYTGGNGDNAVAHLQAFVFFQPDAVQIRLLEGFDIPGPQFFRRGRRTVFLHRTLKRDFASGTTYWAEQLLTLRGMQLLSAPHPDFPRLVCALGHPVREIPPGISFPPSLPEFREPAAFIAEFRAHQTWLNHHFSPTSLPASP